MFCIDYDGPHKNRITLTRGDSATLKLKLYDAQNKPVLLTDADRAVLTIKQDIDSPDVVLQLEAKEKQFDFAPADTADLDCGRYCYDVQVTLSDKDVYTVIPSSDFILAKGGDLICVTANLLIKPAFSGALKKRRISAAI